MIGSVVFAINRYVDFLTGQRRRTDALNARLTALETAHNAQDLALGDLIARVGELYVNTENVETKGAGE